MFFFVFQVTPSRWNPLYIHYMLQYPLNNGDGVMGPFFGELFPSFSLGTSVFDLDFCDPTKQLNPGLLFYTQTTKITLST